MADSITKCVLFSGYKIVHYHLSYGMHSKDISVMVSDTEMTNPSDLEECKTIANEKAAKEREVWLNKLSTSAPQEQEITDLNGSVSL